MVHRIPLSGKRGAGKFALIDDDDLPRVEGYSLYYQTGRTAGLAHVRAYLLGSGAPPGRVLIMLHTLLTGWPKVDHVNGDGLDCTRKNMRPATDGQNAANCKPHQGVHGPKTSRFKGVSRDRNGRWVAQGGSPQRYLGAFTVEEDAARAYDTAAIAAWGPFARTNAALGLLT